MRQQHSQPATHSIIGSHVLLHGDVQEKTPPSPEVVVTAELPDLQSRWILHLQRVRARLESLGAQYE